VKLYDDISTELDQVKLELNNQTKFKGHIDNTTQATCNDISIFKNPIEQYINQFKVVAETQKNYVASNEGQVSDIYIPSAF